MTGGENLNLTSHCQKVEPLVAVVVVAAVIEWRAFPSLD